MPDFINARSSAVYDVPCPQRSLKPVEGGPHSYTDGNLFPVVSCSLREMIFKLSQFSTTIRIFFIFYATTFPDTDSPQSASKI